MCRLTTLAFLLTSGLISAQTFRIASVTPNTELLAGDSVTFVVIAQRSGVTQVSSGRLALREYNAKTNALIRELSTTTGESNGQYRFALIYRVPNVNCYSVCAAGQTPASTELNVRVELIASLTSTNQGTIASAPFPVTVVYPAVTSMTPNTLPLNTFTRPIRLTVKGAKFATARFVQLIFLRSADLTKNLYGTHPDGTDPYEYWFLPGSNQQPTGLRIVGEDSIEFAISAFPGVAAFQSEEPTKAFIGAYDAYVRWDQEAAPGVQRQAHAFTPNVLTVTPALTDDSTRITSLAVVIDRSNPDPGKRKTAVWTPAGPNTLEADPRAFISVTLTGTYKLSRYGAGLLWLAMRDKKTQRILWTPWDYARNTAGKEREIVSQGDGRHVPLSFSYRLPDSPGDLEFYLVLTPQDQATPTNFDTTPAVPLVETFGASAPVSVTWVGADGVPSGAPVPRQTTDTRFVTSAGTGINTQCVKRGGGPLEIKVDVGRVVGAVDAAGKLLDAAKLAQEKVVSSNANLRIASFGRRLSGTAARNDKILFNGKELKALTGDNEKWVEYSVEVPIADVRFPGRVAGSKATPRANSVRIEIDAAGGAENWCSSVAWAELNFNALAPVILVHGNSQGDDNDGGAFWEGKILDTPAEPRLDMKMQFVKPFNDASIPYYHKISMITATTAANGALLGKLIPDAAAEFGARHVHIITHSKGALDTRHFLVNSIPKNFGVYSLHTVAGPHQGSVGPDYQIDGAQAHSFFSNDTTRTKIGQGVAINAGTASLRVSAVEEFNRTNVPLLPPTQIVDGVKHTVMYRSVSGDMNTDNSTNLATGNPTISYAETFGLPGQGTRLNTTWATAMQSAYRITGEVHHTYMDPSYVRAFFWDTPIVVNVVREVKHKGFQLNDLAVTQESSRVGPFVELLHLKANHSTIVSPDVGTAVLESIRKLQPVIPVVP